MKIEIDFVFKIENGICGLFLKLKMRFEFESKIDFGIGIDVGDWETKRS